MYYYIRKKKKKFPNGDANGSAVITEDAISWREWLQEEEVTSERKLRETERNRRTLREDKKGDRV